MRLGLWLAGLAAAAAAAAGCSDPDAVPRDRVTVVGSANLLPGPDAPVSPTLADALLDAAGVADRVARATGNGEGMALLCARADEVARRQKRGERDLLAPDIVLLTRAPAPPELELCRRNGIAADQIRLARYLGGIEGDRDIEGIWMVWDTSQAEASDATARTVAAARGQAALLVDAGPLGTYFSALR
jgi:hypothetical protein